jgi:hypothetical protein
MNLSDAIAGFEAAQAGLTGNDATQVSAQSKFDAATKAKADADAADATAVAAYNASLDALVAAATAAKVDRSAPVVPAPAV